MGKLPVLASTVLLLMAGCKAGDAGTASGSVSVTVAPISTNLHVTGGRQFVATVHNSANHKVVWEVSGAGCTGAACGRVGESGLYTAPATVPSPAKVNVTATAVADSSKSATAVATILPAIVVTVSPVSPNVHVSTTQQFTATVQNAVDSAVTWTVRGTGCRRDACGTVNSSGLYAAPAALPSPATVTITATSVEDTAKSDAAVVVIVPAIVVKGAPANPKALFESTPQSIFTASDAPCVSEVSSRCSSKRAVQESKCALFSWWPVRGVARPSEAEKQANCQG